MPLTRPAGSSPFPAAGKRHAPAVPDRSFDLVTAINTIHNLERDECKQAAREIQRERR